MDFTVHVVQLRGSIYDIGKNMGKFLKEASVIERLKQVTKEEIDMDNMRAIFSAYTPHIIEELHGLAEGLDIPFSKAASLFSGYDVPKTEALGCSVVLTKDYYVRNYDFSPDFYDGILSFLQPKGVFASAGYNLQILGKHDGVNEKGLVAGLHFVSNEGYRKGISSWMAVRMILDTCSNVIEAIELLREIPHAACYNFSIGDSNGLTAIVEVSPEEVVVRWGEDYSACVNHFQQMKRKNRPSIAGSLQREQYLTELKEEQFTCREMFDHFHDPASPVFFHDYSGLFGTLHTFSYEYRTATILTSIAQSNEVLEVNFPKWIEGENVKASYMEGRIIQAN